LAGEGDEPGQIRDEPEVAERRADRRKASSTGGAPIPRTAASARRATGIPFTRVTPLLSTMVTATPAIPASASSAAISSGLKAGPGAVGAEALVVMIRHQIR
jgi:hypothetical protein